MLSFKKYLIETKNTHMRHVDENVFDGGVKGVREAINLLQNIRDTLAGNSKGKVDLTLKADGSPSLVTGVDPTDGKFFVAKKGIFNKNPKVYKTPDDIKTDTSGDLQKKLLLALEYLPEIGIKGIIQGDFMFSSDDLETTTIDGQKYITFQPNTIVYAVPDKTPLAKEIKRAKIGIVWHTSYSGSSFESLSGKFTEDIMKTLKKTKNVWMQGALIRDLSGNASMTKKETDEITKYLSEIGKIFRNTPAKLFDEFKDNNDLQILTKTFINSKVRQSKKINHRTAAKELMDFIYDKYQKDIDTKKTQKSKDSWEQKRKDVMKVFTTYNTQQINNMFLISNLIADAKQIVIDKLSDIGDLNTFLRTRNGFEVTKQEGFVAVDRIGNAVKLVDRLEFSRANFSPEILKGFDKRN